MMRVVVSFLSLAVLLFSGFAYGESDAPKGTELFILFDDSSSMEGERIEQARKSVLALLESLGKNQHIIALDKVHFVPINAEQTTGKVGSQELKNYVQRVSASGGTYMSRSVDYVNRKLPQLDQAVVFAFTDGQISDQVEFERDLRSLFNSQSTADVNFHFLEVGTTNPSITATITELNEKMKDSPIVRKGTAESLSNFGDFEKRMQALTQGILSRGLKQQVAKMFGAQTKLSNAEGTLEPVLRRTQDIKSSVERQASALRKKLEGVEGELKESIAKLDQKTVGEALADYMKAVRDIREVHNDGILSYLRDYRNLTSDMESIEKENRTAAQLVKEMENASNGIKLATAELKTKNPAEYAALPENVRNWIEKESSQTEQRIAPLKTKQEALGKDILALRESVGKTESSALEAFRRLQRDKLEEFRQAYLKRFGKDQWADLMKSSASSGMYYDNSSGEWVMTGVHVTGGGSGSGSSSSRSSGPAIKVRNEGVIINLGGGGGGGTPVSQFINNGTIITKVEASSGGFTFFLNNGNLITISSDNLHKRAGFFWTRFEKGFLIMRQNDQGEIGEVLYVTDEDLAKIAEDIHSSEGKGTPTYLSKNFSNHEPFWPAILNLLVGPEEVDGTLTDLQAKERGGSRPGIAGKLGHTAVSAAELYAAQRLVAPTFKQPGINWPSINKSASDIYKQQQDILRMTDRLRDTAKELADKTKALESLRSSVSGPGGRITRAQLLQKHIDDIASTSKKLQDLQTTIGNRAGTTAELSNALQRATTRNIPQQALRLSGNLLRWGAGTVLAYDAARSTYQVWALDVDPQWRILNKVAPAEAVSRMKNYLFQRGYNTDRERRQMKTEEFFEALK